MPEKSFFSEEERTRLGREIAAIFIARQRGVKTATVLKNLGQCDVAEAWKAAADIGMDVLMGQLEAEYEAFQAMRLSADRESQTCTLSSTAKMKLQKPN